MHRHSGVMLPAAVLALSVATLAVFGTEAHDERFAHYRVRRQAPTPPTLSNGQNESNATKRRSVNEGTPYQLYNWTTAEVYWGIPYAHAPVGNRTFVPPVDIRAEEEVKDQWNEKPRPACPQFSSGRSFDHPPGAYFGSPDCLTLDVYMPPRQREHGENTTVGLRPGPYPVLVFFHGGALMRGSSTDYGAMGVAQQLVSYGIVVVIPQYRLGFLGYFNFRDRGTPGTSLRGTYDQIAALRWVQRHIADFDGDPERVTLGGWSAGACSASLIALAASDAGNKELHGLFNQVLLMSGSIGTCSAGALSNRQVNKQVYEHVVPDGPDYNSPEAITESRKWAENNCVCDDTKMRSENCTDTGVCSGSCSKRLQEQCLGPVSETAYLSFFEFQYPDGPMFKSPKEMLASAVKSPARHKFRILAGTTRDEWAAFDKAIQETVGKGLVVESKALAQVIFKLLVMPSEKNKNPVDGLIDAYDKAGLVNATLLNSDKTDDPDYKAAWYWFYIRLMSDGVFRHPLMADLHAFYRLGHNIYPYVFELESPFDQDATAYRHGPVSTHGMDIPYLFMPEQYFVLGLEARNNVSEATLRAQLPIAEKISGLFWARFIRAEEAHWYRDYTKEALFPYTNLSDNANGYFRINATTVSALPGYPAAMLPEPLYDFWRHLKADMIDEHTGIGFMMRAVHRAESKWIGGLIAKVVEAKKNESGSSSTPPSP